MKKGKMSLVGLAILSLVLVALNAWAVSFDVRKVADKKTPLPGARGKFTFFGDPVVSGANVAFIGSRHFQPEGVYFFNGTKLRRVADITTAIPGGTGNFAGFSFFGPVISGANVAFLASGSGFPLPVGIYFFNDNLLSAIADTNTPLPGGIGSFVNLGRPVISASRVAFYGLGSTGEGVYFFNGTTLTTVADTSTSIPDGMGNFDSFSFSEPAIDGDNVAFLGFGSGFQEGIYLFNGTDIAKVADLNTPIPGGAGNFSGFGDPVISGDTVAFKPFGSEQDGVYVFDGTTLRVVADFNAPVPDGTGHFTSFQDLVVGGSGVAFIARGSSGENGIYLFDGTALKRVADLSTSIPNGTGNFGGFQDLVMSGSNLAFRGTGSGQEGLYFFDGTFLSRVADLSTPVPRGKGDFIGFGKPAISGINVAFVGSGPPQDQNEQDGIYLATALYPFSTGTLYDRTSPASDTFAVGLHRCEGLSDAVEDLGTKTVQIEIGPFTDAVPGNQFAFKRSGYYQYHKSGKKGEEPTLRYRLFPSQEKITLSGSNTILDGIDNPITVRVEINGFSCEVTTDWRKLPSEKFVKFRYP